MHIKNKRGQSTVEYILLVSAVIAVMLIFLNSKNGVFQTQLNSTMTTVAGDMSGIAGTFDTSHALAPANAGGANLPPYNVDVVPNGDN